MKIVIDISDCMFEVIKRSGSGAPKAIDDAIVNGTPLPKGHGKIGDFDVFLKGFLFDKRADHLKCGWIRELIERATIIEADKEEQE